MLEHHFPFEHWSSATYGQDGAEVADHLGISGAAGKSSNTDAP